MASFIMCFLLFLTHFLFHPKNNHFITKLSSFVSIKHADVDRTCCSIRECFVFSDCLCYVTNSLCSGLVPAALQYKANDFAKYTVKPETSVVSDNDKIITGRSPHGFYVPILLFTKLLQEFMYA